jgi:hypothetical protein
MDPKREAYVRLMTEIEELESQVENFTNEILLAPQTPDLEDTPTVEEHLADLKMRLAIKRGDLERLSDGCGKPHPW